MARQSSNGNYLERSQFLGKTYNKLTIQSITEKEISAKDIAHCKCECGKLKDINLLFVVRGEIKSCGCILATSGSQNLLKTIDYTFMKGESYGRLTVTSVASNKISANCKCGSFVELKANQVISGHVKSCGCLKPSVDMSQKAIRCSGDCCQIKPFTLEFFPQHANGQLKSKCLICSGADLKRPRVRVADMTSEYYEMKKEYKTKYNKVYSSERSKIDVNFRLRHITSFLIYLGLKKRNLTKDGKSGWAALPYTVKELRAHLESQFEPWMTWDNWGKYDPETFDSNPRWQLDHIIPQSDFQFKEMGDEEWLKCWNLNNLRPLSAKQNVLDGTRRTRHGSKKKLGKPKINEKIINFNPARLIAAKSNMKSLNQLTNDGEILIAEEKTKAARQITKSAAIS